VKSRNLKSKKLERKPFEKRFDRKLQRNGVVGVIKRRNGFDQKGMMVCTLASKRRIEERILRVYSGMGGEINAE